MTSALNRPLNISPKAVIVGSNAAPGPVLQCHPALDDYWLQAAVACDEKHCERVLAKLTAQLR